MNKLSFQHRLILLSASIMTIVLMLFAAESYFLIKIKMGNDLDKELAHESNEILLTINWRGNQLIITDEFEWKETHHLSGSDNPIYLVIYNSNFDEVIKSSNLEDAFWSVPQDKFVQNQNIFYNSLLSGQETRCLIEPIKNGDSTLGWVVTMSPLKKWNNYLTGLLTIYGLTFPIALILTILGISYAAKKTIQPIKDITQFVHNIKSSKLDKYVPVPDTGDEVTYLAETMNELLLRVDKSLVQIKEFSSNAAHELKTPLTIIQSQINALRNNNNDIIKPIDTIQNEIVRLTRIIENLEILMNTESSSRLDLNQKIWINDLFYEEMSRFEILIKAKSIELTIDEIPSMQINGDPYWMKILVSNLLENAIKFSPNGGSLSIKIQLQKNKLSILFINDFIPKHNVNIDQLTERFYRGKSDQIGSGLGLSIVKWIVDNHSGRLHFEVNTSFTVRVHLPIQR
ncbi:MAG: HAMP domain-containing histidine kinase [Candidatus Marinimicrobia bacterium]|nr:HAMP domain-containing histidine kinase [Candidatus Neomarinimicrobiota bacterium]